MTEWIIIASADKNWGIGYRNKLLARIPEDMKQVSGKTKGNVIVMGRKTLETFPGGKPLPERTNVVLTRNKVFKAEGVIAVNSIDELKEKFRDYQGKIFVFGGESIYRQMLPLCSKAYITRFWDAFEADTFLPCFDSLSDWRLVDQGKWKISKMGLKYRFSGYEKIKP